MTDHAAAVARLVPLWREKAAQLDAVHATMGIGYKVCANELAEALAAALAQPQDEGPTEHCDMCSELITAGAPTICDPCYTELCRCFVAARLEAAVAAPPDEPPAKDRCSECGEPRPCRAARRLAHPHEEQP